MASESHDTEEYLFSNDVISKLDFSKKTSNLPDDISPASPGNSCTLRPLSISDYNKGFIQLLSQLTYVGDVTKEMYELQFRQMKASNASYYIIVIEDHTLGKIVGSATLHIERKFIHSAALRGRIEDVVVLDTHRGRELGKLLVETLCLLAGEIGCYKLSLDCKPDRIDFYAKFGFQNPSNVHFLTRRFIS